MLFILSIVLMLITLVSTAQITSREQIQRDHSDTERFEILASTNDYLSVSLKNQDNVKVIYIFNYSDECVNIMMHNKNETYEDNVELLETLGYTENSNHRVWVRDNAVAYILWDWDKHSWFISIYKK